jgi:uncharacterized Fe-S center protein
MTEDVYFLPVSEGEDDIAQSMRLEKALAERASLSFIQPRDMVAVKTHFGEKGSNGFVRPVFMKAFAGLIKKEQGIPFLTETATLYRGQRSNAVEHINMAAKHGFTSEATDLPIIMADGLLGDEEVAVDIPGKLYSSVYVATLIVKSQALILVSHFTGHLAAGFGAALKNLGMGCASRRGKLVQHSTAKPSIKKANCTACGECVRWCPQDAITLKDGAAVINRKLCIGCGECLAVCRFEAVGYNWSETYEQLQRKVTEHAWGAVIGKGEKVLCFNFLTRITKDCDCMGTFEPISPDIGILFAKDPVALDAASLDLLEERAGRKMNRLAYDIPYRLQLDHAREIGFGTTDYRLIEVR